MQIKVIGIGGIGCCLLPCLARFLRYQYKGRDQVRIVLIDGDSFEQKNVERQDFIQLGNKATVKVKELRADFSTMMIDDLPLYLTEDSAPFFIEENDIVFVGVDNHATRKIVAERAMALQDIFVISGGNELTDGNVRFHLRRGGRDITLPLLNRFHPEIMHPRDKNPADLGCGELVTGEPQLLLMNNLVAAHMLAGFYAFLKEKLDYDEVYLDLLTGMARPVKRPREKQ